MAQDVPRGAKLPTHEEVAECIEAVAPEFEIADDSHAYHTQSGKDSGATLLTLGADNAWNSGVVFGEWKRESRGFDLAATTDLATVKGGRVGEGAGRAVLGHPVDVMRWIARHFQSHGTTLKRGEFVITGASSPRNPSTPETGFGLWWLD